MSLILSDFNPEARIILTLCSGEEELYITQIAKKTAIPNVTVYEKLFKLKTEGLVQSESKGKMKFYTLTDKGKERADSIIKSIFNVLESCNVSDKVDRFEGSTFIKPKKEKISPILLNNLQNNLKNIFVTCSIASD